MTKLHNINSTDMLSTSWIDRLSYCRDASVYRMVPEAVAKPKNENEIEDLFNYSRNNKIPITFRTAGTSLSGQSVTNGILVEVKDHWNRFRVLDGGNKIFLQPGVNGATANQMLSSYNRKIGPDPASINAACIGGIVSNNSSGMVCGTEHNSYNTLESIRFMLPNGHVYESGSKGESKRFQYSEPELFKGILNIKSYIDKNKRLYNKIINKYRIKNTVGYSMNSFVDYSDPLDIFSHLLIGSEGTLAFISAVTLDTVPDYEHKSTGLILYNSSISACNSVMDFKDSGANAIEFLDDNALRTAVNIQNPPYNSKEIEDGFSGILVEYHCKDYEILTKRVEVAKEIMQKSNSINISSGFCNDTKKRESLWKIRKGLYPTVGALRKIGTTVITEDIAVDVQNFSDIVDDMKNIFKSYGFNDAVTFGHAKDGNLHYVCSVDLETSSGVKNYELLLDKMSEITLNNYNGSLKAEHGTGRNMAPFVEKEWGGEIFDIMWNIKSLSDPDFILNPDVILTRDSKIHIKSLKPMPKVNGLVDTCVECGFCEKVCPSTGYTLSPRQRIGLMRELELIRDPIIRSDIDKDLEYYLDKSCATDGLCEDRCPVNINTGEMIRDYRVKTNNNFPAHIVENNFSLSLAIFRFLLKIGNYSSRIMGKEKFKHITNRLNNVSNGLFPVWPTMGFNLAKNSYEGNCGMGRAETIMYPSCVGRILSGDSTGTSNVEYMIMLSNHVGTKLHVLDDYDDFCCGMSFDSHGQRKVGIRMAEKLTSKLYKDSDNGRIPIVIDNSPCTYHLKDYIKGSNYDLTILDIIEYLDSVKEKCNINPINEKYFVHAPCSAEKMSLNNRFHSLMDDCVSEVMIDEEQKCCGAAGDKSLRHPGLSAYASNKLLLHDSCSDGVSSSITCELGMSEATGKNFKNIIPVFCKAAGISKSIVEN